MEDRKKNERTNERKERTKKKAKALTSIVNPQDTLTTYLTMKNCKHTQAHATDQRTATAPARGTPETFASPNLS